MGFKGVCILRTCFHGHVAAHYRFNSNPFMKVTAKLVIVKPRLHLPRSSYNFSVCDFPYDFLDIAGDRGFTIHTGIARFFDLPFADVLIQKRKAIVR